MREVLTLGDSAAVLGVGSKGRRLGIGHLSIVRIPSTNHRHSQPARHHEVSAPLYAWQGRGLVAGQCQLFVWGRGVGDVEFVRGRGVGDGRLPEVLCLVSLHPDHDLTQLFPCRTVTDLSQ